MRVARQGSIAIFASVATLLCAPAHAQFFTSLVITKSGAATCNSVAVSQPNSASTAEINAPAAPNNTVSTLTINGGAPDTISESLPGPFPIIDSVSNTPVISLFAGGAQTMPYTLVNTFFPEQDGLAVGTGYMITAVCNSPDDATFTIVNGILPGAVAPSGPAVAVPVPTLSPLWLMALAALLGLLALLHESGSLRRRRRATA